MARILGSDAETCLPLEAWQHLRVTPGAFGGPDALPIEGWQSFAAPGLFGPTDDGTLAEAQDHWLRHTFAKPLDGLLIFEGLASHCDIYLDGKLAAQHRSMFVPLRLEVSLPAGSIITLHFQCLDAALKAAPRRSRWRPMMIEPNGLRHLRTTALGSMDGWTPEGRPTGPYRAIWAVACAPGRHTRREIAQCEIEAQWLGDTARLRFHLSLKPGIVGQHLRLTCAGRSLDLLPDSQGHFSGTLALSGIAPWWPNGMGEQALHEAFFEIDGTRFDLGKVGFRAIEVDRGPDGRGFGLTINGGPVFCRGAVWMTPDAAHLPGASADYLPLLTLARDAGMTMLRVPGVGVYESAEFFALCDAFGLLVMQDVMLANFDYPQADEAFCTALETEVQHLLAQTQGNPSLALLCGGSEVFQQAAMLGAPPEDWSGPVFDEMLPALIARHRPGLPYAPNSPSGGALPFVVNEGVGHYFGVGAYRRPLEDARRAEVRFASECLAFANVPVDAPLMHAGVPRDAGADWDFADVRHHYARLLFGAAADDPARAHACAEAASAHVMETTFHEWRRAGSPTRGALVLALSNLVPGAGWGVIDETGVPKAAYYALRRAFRPLHLGITDEGVNGLGLHLVNETGEAFAGEIALEAYREGRVVVAQGRKPVALGARESLSLSGFDVLGGFFDLTYAYRFGAREHDGVRASLLDAAGARVSEAFHFPDMGDIAPVSCGLVALAGQDAQGAFLELSTQRLARFVGINAPGFVPEDTRFHLAPGTTRRLRLKGEGKVRGCVKALNAFDEVCFGD